MKPLIDRDFEVLAELVFMRFESGTKELYVDGAAPIQFGGSNGSHHGKTAMKLMEHGFVEGRKRGRDWGDMTTNDARGSNVYRATEAGRDALNAWNVLKKGGVIGPGPMVRKFGHLVPSTTRPLTDEEKAELRRECHLEIS